MRADAYTNPCVADEHKLAAISDLRRCGRLVMHNQYEFGMEDYTMMQLSYVVETDIFLLHPSAVTLENENKEAKYIKIESILAARQMMNVQLLL